MKTNRILLTFALAAAALLGAGTASAGGYHGGYHGGYGHYHGYYGPRFVFGVNVGWPYYGYGYGYYPYYYPGYAYYPPYAVQQQPSTYVEQPQQQAQQPAAGFWYYCADSRAYYPYVKDCPAGWQRVAPQPQN